MRPKFAKLDAKYMPTSTNLTRKLCWTPTPDVTSESTERKLADPWLKVIGLY